MRNPRSSPSGCSPASPGWSCWPGLPRAFRSPGRGRSRGRGGGLALERSATWASRSDPYIVAARQDFLRSAGSSWPPPGPASCGARLPPVMPGGVRLRAGAQLTSGPTGPRSRSPARCWASRLRLDPEAKGAPLLAAEARARADAFLIREGVDLSRYEPPEIRSQQLARRVDLTVRYRDRRESARRPAAPTAIEVFFAGDRLAGFDLWLDDPREKALARSVARDRLPRARPRSSGSSCWRACWRSPS